MPKFKQGKKLIILILCLMIIMLATFSCIIIFDKKRNKSYQPQASASVTMNNFWSGEGMDWTAGLNGEYTHADREKNYNNYDIYTISDFSELDIFRHLVSADGFNFSGKTVKVLQDIDMYGIPWAPIGVIVSGAKLEKHEGGTETPFRGTFDGGGHTISNLNMQVLDDDVVDGFYLGFFGIINNAIIQNIRIKDFSIIVGDVAGSFFCCGGLVGEIQGINNEIDNCIVEDFYCVMGGEDIGCPDPNVGIYIGGIAGEIRGEVDATVSLTMSNCYTGGRMEFAHTSTNIENYYPAGIINVEPVMGFSGNATWWPIINISNCLASEFVCGQPYGLTVYGNNKTLHYLTYGTAPSCVTSSNVYSKAKDSQLVVKTALASESAWHVPPTNEFNDGWPYLKSFIIFNKWTFKGSSKGTINNGFEEFVLEIPNTIDISTLVVSQYNYFYGQVVIATPNTGYYFTKWEASADDKTFTAYFDLEAYLISKIMIVYNNQVLQSQDLDNVTINYNGNLSLRVYANENSFKISIYVGGNVKGEINISDGTKYVLEQFAIENISDYTINCQSTAGYTTAYMRLSTDLGDNMQECQLAIELKLKTYGIEVG